DLPGSECTRLRPPLSSAARAPPRDLLSFPTRRSSDLSFTRWYDLGWEVGKVGWAIWAVLLILGASNAVNLTDGLDGLAAGSAARSEEHTSELQSRENLVCRLLLEKKKRAHLSNPRAHA